MSDHKLDHLQVEFNQSYCAEPGCEFFGERAQQGVCYSAEPELLDAEKVLAAAEQFAKELLRIKEHMKGTEEYTAWLEAMYECTTMNWTMTLDECVRLRAENARLRKDLKR